MAELRMTDYAGKGTTGLAIGGLTTGIIGTVGALGGLGALANRGIASDPNGGEFVTKDELKMMYDLSAKDSEIALLKSQNDSEKKMLEVYTTIDRKANDIRAEFQAYKDTQNIINANQGITNANVAAAVAANNTSITEVNNLLKQVIKPVIPNSSVCPGWGGVTITPTAATVNGTTIA